MDENSGTTRSTPSVHELTEEDIPGAGERGSETPVSHPTGEESRASPCDIRTELCSMTTAFARQMARLSSRLDLLSETVDGSATPRRVDLRDPVAAIAFSSPSERNPALWCDCPVDEPIPNDTPVWPNEEDPALEDEPSESTDGCLLHQVSTVTGALLKEAFSAVTTNGTFLQRPNQRGRPPQLTFTEREEECMQTEVLNMLEKQLISQVSQNPEGFYSQMFLVPKKDGRQRPVINLKRLNQSVKTEHFKMEGIHMLKDLLRAGDLMAKIDLKDAYFMIPIAQEDRDFLKFQWKDQTYQFNCLPFGLSSAPWVCTKTTRPVVAALREIGLCLIIYIDDILVMAETESLLKDHVTAVMYLLENLGLVINHPKSKLDPSQEIEFLGFNVNSKTMELKLPREKIKKIRTEAGKVMQPDTVSGLTLSRLIGKMNAATQAIPMAPLYYKKPPDLSPRGPAGGSELLLNNSVDKGGKRRAGVVERSLYSVE